MFKSAIQAQLAATSGQEVLADSVDQLEKSFLITLAEIRAVLELFHPTSFLSIVGSIINALDIAIELPSS